MHLCRPYEPPPDYPTDSGPTQSVHIPVHYEPRSRSRGGEGQVYANPLHYPPRSPMLRSRQFPEVAGLLHDDAPASLQRVSRFPDGPAFPSSSRIDHPNFPTRRPIMSASTSNIHRGHQRILPATISSYAEPRVPPPIGLINNNNSYETPIGHLHPRFQEPPPAPSAPSTPSLLLRSAMRSPATSPLDLTRGALRKSCPDLDRVVVHRERDGKSVRRTKKSSRRRKEDEWRSKTMESWSLDDVLFWLQDIGEDELATVVVGYDARGEDVARWRESDLQNMGVLESERRRMILRERDSAAEGGSRKKEERPSLFDIVAKSAGDQILIVETPLTARDVIVGRGQAGCLAVTKVVGSNLPLIEGDSLLEINGIAGEQFKSALMLTKLISDSGGRPIRFVVLRNKQLTRRTHDKEDSPVRDSSSGVSSSSPVFMERMN